MSIHAHKQVTVLWLYVTGKMIMDNALRLTGKKCCYVECSFRVLLLKILVARINMIKNNTKEKLHTQITQ